MLCGGLAACGGGERQDAAEIGRTWTERNTIYLEKGAETPPFG